MRRAITAKGIQITYYIQTKAKFEKTVSGNIRKQAEIVRSNVS